MLRFPNAAHDDQVDAMVMAIHYMKESWHLEHPEDPEWDDPPVKKRLHTGELNVIYTLKGKIMAIEKNPFDKIEETISNVVKLPEQIKEATGAPSFEVEDDGGVTVDFTQVNIEMEPESEMQEWYGNLADTLDDEN